MFPFKSLETLKLSLRNGDEYIGEKLLPSYDIDGVPSNVDTVFDLFDTYEDAKIKAQEKNEEMQRLQKLAIYQKDFIELSDICALFEKLILLNTEDMPITCEMDEEKMLSLLKMSK